jgi:hypothetical protein
MKSAVFARICIKHAQSRLISSAPLLIKPARWCSFSTSSRGWNEKQRAEAATALLKKCDIELPGRNTFDIHAKSSHQLSAERQEIEKTDNANENEINGGASKAMYMDPNVIDPFKLMEPQLRAMKESVKLLVTSDNPVLQKVELRMIDLISQ